MILDKAQIQQKPNILKRIFSSIKSIFGSVRGLITAIVIFIQVSIFALVLMIIFKPPIFWNPIKAYLNDGITSEQSEMSLDLVYDKINNVHNIEVITLSEQEIALLLINKYPKFNKLDVTFGQDDLQLLLNIDESEEEPLWLKADFTELTDHGLRLRSIGFVRYNITQSLLDKVTSNEYLISVLDILDKESVDDMLTAIIDKELLEEGVSITSATITDGELAVVVENNQNILETNL